MVVIFCIVVILIVMFILGNLFIALAQILSILLTLIFWLVLIRALISWVSPDPYNPFVQFLYRATDPLLEPIRRRMPPMSVDISPMIVWMIIVFLQMFLVVSLRDLGYHMRHSGTRSVDVIQMFDDRPAQSQKIDERIF